MHEELVAAFLEFACWDHNVHGQGDYVVNGNAAMRILAQNPEIARHNLYTAVVCGEVAEVRRILAERPESARESGGSRGWPPLLYLCYARLSHDATNANAVEIANALLEQGADSNSFYPAGDSSYTALVGVAGEGEQDAAIHPKARELYALLLQRGAGPYDIQVLYNTHFHGNVLWWLELTYEYCVRTGRKSDWANSEWPMLDMRGYGSGARYLLTIALKKNDLPLTEWLLTHGANPDSAPARDPRYSKRSLYEEALRQGHTEMAALLARYGAAQVPLVLNDREAFASACFRLDRGQALAYLEKHPEFRNSPYAVFAAVKRDRADVVSFLLDLGVSIEIEDMQRQRPLHKAASHKALRVAALLLERGAEPDPRESNWNATPLGYATHHWHVEMIDLLSRHSRDVRNLAFNAKVERLRDVLNAEPALARVVSKEGYTPLWWLPDDERIALEIIGLFLDHGADPSRASANGTTAAGLALKRGMKQAAQRLSQ